MGDNKKELRSILYTLNFDLKQMLNLDRKNMDISAKINKVSRSSSNSNLTSNQNSFVQERLQGMQLIQVFNRQKQEYKKFDEINITLKELDNILMDELKEREAQELSKEELIAECIENTERKEMAEYFLMETKQHSAFVAYSTKIEKEAGYVI